MFHKLFFFLLFLPPAYLVYLICVYARTRVPYAVTSKKRIPLILKHINITPATIIYDLGCGKGDVLFAAEKFHPKKLVGFELSPMHAWYAQAKAFFLKSKIQIYRQDFFTANIGEADIIYIFLVQAAVEKIWVKIQKEAKAGAKVVVLSNTLPGMTGEYFSMKQNGKQIPGGLYIYTIGSQNAYSAPTTKSPSR